MEKIQSKGVFDHTLKVLRKNIKTTVLAVVFFSLLYTFLYGVWVIPGIDLGFHRDSEVTAFDWIYIPLISLMSGFLATLMKYKFTTSTITAGSAGGIISGLGAASCPVCQGITLVAFGGNIAFLSFGGFSPFVWVLQVVAIFILWISLYLTANNVYTNNCISCNISSSKISGSKASRIPISKSANKGK